ncbi:MAG: family 20 glycosylhydrolase [Clostridia bacterium]|nr:family 20 glycosylhydrolase [Clostridia bacterium]
MIQLIPSVKNMHLTGGTLSVRGFWHCFRGDERVQKALCALPHDPHGTKIELFVGEGSGEEYSLSVQADLVKICAEGPAGAFYAVQTLRQLANAPSIPLLEISDKPDFSYRGFYHDVTRGKVPTVQTVKELIDRMAYFKMNALQLYVEHTFDFREYASVTKQTGCFTREEILEIGAYCKENFISFEPSLSTFGHLYELLEQPQYQHLRVLKDYEKHPHFWHERMAHHTIDPKNPESIKLIQSLIDQYEPLFDSEYFNICCDETFDLKNYEKGGEDVGKLYADFVGQIVSHVNQKGKKAMMWADILQEHPETIHTLPEDTCFLNWEYSANAPEEKVASFARLGRRQIVCPGTSTWSRFCENIHCSEENISKMAEYGFRHGAVGVLNTNWGDYGNPCSLELSLYGLVLGAEKSWAATSEIGEDFHGRVNALLYRSENGFDCALELSRIHNLVSWNRFCTNFFRLRYLKEETLKDCLFCEIGQVQHDCLALRETLEADEKLLPAIKEEMLLTLEALLVMAEANAKLFGHSFERVTDTHEWLGRYRKAWLDKNKPSELSAIEKVFCEYETAAKEGFPTNR